MKKILITGGSGFIGTNLIEYLLSINIEVLNIDIQPPKIDSHKFFWRNIDIRDQKKLAEQIKYFLPVQVIHLAARTDLNGLVLDDYTSNTDGTRSLINALNESNFSGEVVFASSMYVCRPGYQPLSNTDYCAHTVYGESKVAMEKIIRQLSPSYSWSIIRPTSIWGPWFDTPYRDFFNIVLQKKFFHIKNVNTQKTYGYVENSVFQIMAVLDNLNSSNKFTKNNVVYIGDWPKYSILEWADEISIHVPYKIPTLPYELFFILGKLGDFLSSFNIKFPMTSFRLSNMTTNNVHDLNLIEKLVPILPYSRQQGTEKTVAWLRSQSKI